VIFLKTLTILTLASVLALSCTNNHATPPSLEFVAVKEYGAYKVGQTQGVFIEDRNIFFCLQNDAHVKVEIYNATGQLLEVLADAEYKRGCHNLGYDWEYPGGRELEKGTYVLKAYFGNPEYVNILRIDLNDELIVTGSKKKL